MSEISIDLNRVKYIEHASELYLILPNSDDVSRVLAVVSRRLVHQNIILFPSEGTKIFLRYEFLSNGRWRLKKEAETTAVDLLARLSDEN